MDFLEGILSIVSFAGILFVDDFNLSEFNLDQMLGKNMNRMHPLYHRFMHQCLHYSTSQQGGILDLVFDSKIAQNVPWIP